MKSDYEVELTNGVSKKYWIDEQGLTDDEYKQVRTNCTSGNFGFCESCMAAIYCKNEVKLKFKCCICKIELVGMNAAVEHRIPNKEHNYETHPVVPVSHCVMCAGECKS